MSAPTMTAAEIAAIEIGEEARQWRQGLSERSAAALLRRAERAAARQDAARRRAHGMIDRRAARLARARAPGPFPPDPACTQ
jgi:hypothetical protein